MNPDFVAMLSALHAAGADYLIVGAHALAAHGRPRATGDLDLWVRRSAANAARVFSALEAFGAPLDQLTLGDLQEPNLVFQIGVAPSRIDILTSLSGIAFDEAWPNRTTVEISGLQVPVIGRAELIANKRATGRLRDLADLEELGEG